MSRTSYDPVLDARVPESGGLYPTPVRPWWETMRQDPWYITGAKAVLGEREVEELRTGDVEPWIATLAPLLVTGGRGVSRPPGPVWEGRMSDFLFGGRSKLGNFLGASPSNKLGKWESKFYDWMFGTKPSKPPTPPPPPVRTYDPDVFVPGKPFDPETFVTEPQPKVWETNLYDRKYSGPLGGQEWADIHATPDVEFTAGSPRDPTEVRRDLLQNNPTEYWKLYSRGLLPGNKNNQMWGNAGFDYENWNYAPRPEVSPPYNSKSPLKITPEDNLPLPPATDITPPDPNDRMWWYRQPRPPFLSEVTPQMRFYPQTDWMQQLYQSQLYPEELNWRVA